MGPVATIWSCYRTDQWGDLAVCAKCKDEFMGFFKTEVYMGGVRGQT